MSLLKYGYATVCMFRDPRFALNKRLEMDNSVHGQLSNDLSEHPSEQLSKSLNEELNEELNEDVS
jgi:hypothetical protein